ncbi:hypothetical protein ACFXGT_02585 [Streptomyces sp. NPDC059352]|uniref:hypothetical protein n=1 Tax=Streptomyces sp. NPDC059352 TaxID=3346810 RepID=UPI0036A0D0DA
MTSLHINRAPAVPAPHPLRRVTDWPLADTRRSPVRRSPHGPTGHPARRASDRLRAAVPPPRSMTHRRRGTARRRRARTVRTHAPRHGDSAGPAGSDGPAGSRGLPAPGRGERSWSSAAVVDDNRADVTPDVLTRLTDSPAPVHSDAPVHAEAYGWEIARRFAAAGAHVTLVPSRYPGSRALEYRGGIPIVRGSETSGVYGAAAAHPPRKRVALIPRAVPVRPASREPSPRVPLVVAKKPRRRVS